MMEQGNMALLMPDDVARAVVDAVSQPRHILLDTIELQPSVPRKSQGDPQT
jgi:NADP-dependent 3-hydroxy acid dehydrogenase YdfG